MHTDSWNAYLSAMVKDERRYVEVAHSERITAMRTINTPKSRRPASMAGMEFSVTLYTAIGASDCSDVRYLLAVDCLNDGKN